MKKLLSGLLLSFLFLPQLTQAEESAYGPNSIRIIYVEMLDEATGGCWTNISEMQRYAEDQLTLNGYVITGFQEGEVLHTPEITRELMQTTKRLPASLSKSAIEAVRNHVYFDNLYVLQVFVGASRNTTYKCWGDAQVLLSRQVVNHMGEMKIVPFEAMGSRFIGQDNVNTFLFDLTKDFISQLKGQE
jgi:hypothetical protein